MSQPPSRTRGYTHGPHIYPRGPKRIWYAYTPQYPKGKSLGTSNRAEAEQRFRTLLSGEHTARGVGRPAEELLIKCFTAFLSAPHGYTRRTLRTHAERLSLAGKQLGALGVEYPSEITAQTLDRWLDERGKTRSRATLNRDIRTLKVCLRWCAARGLCAPVVPVVEREVLREPVRAPRHVVPDPEEMRRILAELDQSHVGASRAVRCLYATGVRIEELLRLRAGDLRGSELHVSPEAGSMRDAEPGKGYRDRAIRLAPAARDAVVAWLAWTAEHGIPGSTYWLRYRLHLACDAAGVERCGFHDLRRAFATSCARAGIDLVVIARWLGHRLVQTTERYLAEYRSDRRIEAPVPGGLNADSRAESLQKVRVDSGVLQSIRGVKRGEKKSLK